MKSLRRAGFLFSIAALLLAGQSVVEASHFRGGNMSVSVSPSGVLTVSSETLWRKGGDEFSVFPLGGISRSGFLLQANGDSFIIDFQINFHRP